MQQAQAKEKLYTVSQVAEIFKTSNVTMYKKIKKLEKELENEQIKNGRTTYLTEKAIEIIRENTFMDYVEEEDPGAEDLGQKDLLVKALESHMQSLKEQLEIKEISKNEEIERLVEQLREKDKQIEKFQLQAENFQVLIRDKDKEIKKLENKEEVAITEVEKVEEEPQQRGFFGLFKKKR